MFQLTPEETNCLILQIARSKRKGRGGRRGPPNAFTEHGVAMLSSVLGSERAVRVNIVIVRAFIKLREVISNQQELAQRVDSLEQRYGKHDNELQAVFEAIGQLHQTRRFQRNTELASHSAILEVTLQNVDTLNRIYEESR